MSEPECKNTTTRYFSACACHPLSFRLDSASQETQPIDADKRVQEFSCEEMQADAITQQIGANFGDLKL